MFELTTLKAWILTVMLAMAPHTPWKETYDATAEAMADAAMDHPLFSFKTEEQRAGAAKRTASVYLAVAFFEGSFNPAAAGDCPDKKADGTCKKGSAPSSFGMFQVNNSNFKYLGLTAEDILGDVRTSVEAAHKMMAASFAMCRGKADDRDLLNWYTSGGPDCSTTSPKGRHRMNMAHFILGKYPFPTE